MLYQRLIGHTLLLIFLVLCTLNFIHANSFKKHRQYASNQTIIKSSIHKDILQPIHRKDNVHKSKDERQRIHRKKKDHIPTRGFQTIANSYLRNHMPSVDEAQKRTRLKEKELKFYGTLITDRTLPSSHSRLKEGGSRHDITKSFYGSKDNPAKSCRDIFLTDRKAKSGNYYIRTSDGEILMFMCDKEPYYANEKVSISKPVDETLAERDKTNTQQIELEQSRKHNKTVKDSISSVKKTTRMPVNVVLPDRNEVVMTEEPEEIKDLTKNANKVEGGELKNSAKNETNTQKTKEDTNTEKQKEEEVKEKPTQEETNEEKNKGKTKKPPSNPEPEPTKPSPTEGLASSTTKPFTTVQTTIKPLPLEARNMSAPIASTTQQPVATTARTPTTPMSQSRPPHTTVDPKTAGKVQKGQYNSFEKEKQQTNPYFPDFPASNPDANPPLPPSSNKDDGNRPPPHNQPQPPERPPDMVGYGFNGPPPPGRSEPVGRPEPPFIPPPPPNRNEPVARPEPSFVPPPPPGRSEAEGRPETQYIPPPPPYGFRERDRERARYRPQYSPSTLPPPRYYREPPFGRYPPPPSRPYSSGSHFNEENLAFGDSGVEDASIEKHKAGGNAGDLGDIQDEQPTVGKLHQPSSSDDAESLYGRRQDRPKRPEMEKMVKADQTAEKPVARSVSWGFHENVMFKEHSFNQQYKDFEDMDKAIDKKHKKYRESKPVQERASVRSWKTNRNDMIKKISKEQYDSFEKTNQQIEQDMASKTYREQYDGFETFRNATSNPNASNETSSAETNPFETPPNNNPSNPFEPPANNTPSNPNEPPPNNSPSNPFEPPANNTPSNPNEPPPNNSPSNSFESPTNSTPSNPYEPPANNTSANPFEPPANTIPSNPSEATTQSHQPSPAQPNLLNNTSNATDYYKQYVNVIDPPDNSIPEFPNATSQKSFLENGTYSPPGQPAEATLLTDGQSYSITTGNLSALSTNSSTTPPSTNSSTIPPSTNSTSSVVNSTTLVSNHTTSKALKLQPLNDNMAMKRGNSIYPEDLIQRLISIKESLDKENTGSKRFLEGHSKYQLHQISGPPNPSLLKDTSIKHFSKLKLRNLTGEVVVNDNIEEDRKKDLTQEKDSQPDADSASSLNSIASMVKTGAIPLEGVDSKEVIDVLKSILKQNVSDGKSIEDSQIIRRQQEKDKKVKTIPNPNGFIIPQTKKFAIDDGGVYEEKLMEILGQRAISAKRKQKEIQQKKRISQIKAQALSKREPQMGRFSTANLKEFSYEKHPNDDSGGSDKFSRFLKLAKDEILKNKFKDSAHHLDLEMLSHPDFHQGELLKSLSKIHQHGLLDETSHKGLSDIQIYRKNFTPTVPSTDKAKRQNIKNIHDSLFNAHLNMQDLIRMTQQSMDNVPGLTEENKKIDEKTGTSNETMEELKAEQKAVKEGVNQTVSNETKENNQKVHQTVQTNQPQKKDYTHNVMSKAMQGAEKVRHKLQDKMYEKFKGQFMGFDFKHTVPKIGGSQEYKQELHNANPLRKSGVLFSDGDDLISKTVRKIQNETKKVEEKVQETVQKAQNDHIKQMNRVFKDQDQGGIIGNATEMETIPTLNAEALPGMNRRSWIINGKKRLIAVFDSLGNGQRNYQQHQKTFRRFSSHVPHHNRRFQHHFSKNALANIFFEEEKNSLNQLVGTFPEKKESVRKERKPRRLIDGKVLGSRARSFRKTKLANFHRKLMSRRSKRSSHHTTLRGLIPNAIGEISPSRDKPLPTTKVKPKATDTPPQEKLESNQPVDSSSLQQLLLLKQRLQQRIEQQLKEKQNKVEKSPEGENEDQKNQKETGSNIGEDGTSPSEDEGQPGGKPNSSPEDDKDKGDENKEKQEPSGGDGSGKNEVGTHLTTKLKKNKDKKPATAFEAGLNDIPDAPTRPPSENKKLKPTTTDGTGNKETSDNKEANVEGNKEEHLSNNGLSTSKSHSQDSNKDINQQIKTALELSIINLLNKTAKQAPQKPEETTNHAKQMEELNHKYEALKLPIEHGELWPEGGNSKSKALNDKDKAFNHTHRHHRPILPPIKDHSTEIQVESTEFPEIVDATPTEGPSDDYLAQRLKLMGLSSLLQEKSANVNKNKHQNNDKDQEPDGSKGQGDLDTNKSQDPTSVEQMTIHLQPLPQPQEPSDNTDNINPSQTTPPTMEPSMTPAELAKKLLLSNLEQPITHQQSLPNSQDLLDLKQQASTSQQPLPDKQEVPNSNQKQNPNPTLNKSENNGIPIIPVPMDSQLGELLYPALQDGKITHNTSTSVLFDGHKQVINTNVDGKNYSAVLIDQTKQLMEDNKINKKDLMDLLISTQAFDNIRPTKPYEKKNSISNRLNVNEPHTTVSASKRHEKQKEKNESIHITLQNTDGQFYLIPDQTEALQKHFVPQKIGLKLVPKKTS